MNDVAFGAQLAEVADFGVDRGQEEAGVGDVAVADVPGAIIPRQAHAREGLIALSRSVEGWYPRGGEELHNAGDGVGRAITHRPTWRTIHMVF